MAKRDKRINTSGKEEIIITDINDDLNGLIDVIDEIRGEEKLNNPNAKRKRIFIPEHLDFHKQPIIEREINFSDCIFEKEVNFSEICFSKKIRFHHCIFKKRVFFENTTFEELVDFYDAVFKEAQQFYRVNFKKVVVFSNTKFEDEAQFLYCTTVLETYLNFENANFKKCLDISRSNFNNSLNFWNVKIEGDNNIPKYIHYKDSFGIHKNGNLNVYTSIRESYRRIKKSFTDNGNKILESEFAVREQQMLLKELFSNSNETEEKNYFTGVNFFLILIGMFLIYFIYYFDKDFIWIIILFCIAFILILLCFCYRTLENIFKHRNDLIMLILNKYSNNFGQSWIRGVCFTIILGAITFYLLRKFSAFEIEWNMYNFIKVFNILEIKPFENKSSEEKDIDFGYKFYLTLIIGRIFILYGNYQTIQAFRKYGK